MQSVHFRTHFLQGQPLASRVSEQCEPCSASSKRRLGRWLTSLALGSTRSFRVTTPYTCTMPGRKLP